MIASFSWKTWVLVALASVVLVIGGVALSGSGKPEEAELVARRMDLVETVSVTGRVAPAESVDLSFEKSGRITAVRFGVGSFVREGDVLVTLEHADQNAQLLEAQAALERVTAQADEIRLGARSEEIALSEAKVVVAQEGLASAERSLADAYDSARVTADDLVRTKADPLFSNGDSPNPHFNLIVSDDQLVVDVEAARLRVRSALLAWSDASARSSLEQVSSFFDKLGVAVASAQAGATVSQSTLDAYKSAVSAARTGVSSALSNVVSKENAVAAAKASLLSSERELTLKKAGPTSETLRQQVAEVKRAQANVDSVRAQIARSSLRAPLDGVVSVQTAKVGEIVSPGVTVVSLSSIGYLLEAYIPEADIAKVALQNEAKVTLDAYGSDVVFDAVVVSLDPTETLTEGVATYKIKLFFRTDDKRIKSGMTANIDIQTSKREQVIALPARAVVSRDEGSFAQIRLSGGKVEERKVETGIRNADGFIEIVSGVSEGEEVVASPEDK